MIFDFIRSEKVEIFRNQCLDEPSRIAARVEDDGVGRLELAHRGVPRVARVSIGVGKLASASLTNHRWQNTLITPGPSRSDRSGDF